jgi:hypothetical protein
MGGPRSDAAYNYGLNAVALVVAQSMHGYVEIVHIAEIEVLLAQYVCGFHIVSNSSISALIASTSVRP